MYFAPGEMTLSEYIQLINKFISKIDKMVFAEKNTLIFYE